MRKKGMLLVMMSLILAITTACSSYGQDIGIPKVVQNENIKTIVVAGAEPEGIVAAVILAQRGHKVYLLDHHHELGGLFTVGMMTALDLNYTGGSDNSVLHKGYFTEFYKQSGDGNTLDLVQTREFFEKEIKKYNIDYINNIEQMAPIMEDNDVRGVEYTIAGETNEIMADWVIDSTQEAGIARQAGATYRIGREELNQKDTFAAATLVFSVKGVEYSEVIKSLKSDGNPNSGTNGNAAWGYPEMYDYPAESPTVQMRGLNISRQNSGSLIMNALLVFDVNPLDKASREQGISSAKKELTGIIEYMRRNLKGFENAELDEVAGELYIREGIRIIGEDMLTGKDIFSRRDWSNKVAYGSYPIDLQTSYKGGYGNALCGSTLYQIPLGTMIPQGVNKLLVIGKSSSFDIIAHGSARVVPVLMAMAEGATIALDYAIEIEEDIRIVNQDPIHMKKIQDRLLAVDIPINMDVGANELKDHWVYPYVENLFQEGFLSLGYDNKRLEIGKPATKKAISGVFSLVSQHSTRIMKYSKIHDLPDLITKEQLLDIWNEMLESNLETWEEVYATGLLTEEVYKQLANDPVFNNEHVYGIIDDMIREYLKQSKTPKAI